MKPRWDGFKSTLAPGIEQYLGAKRAVGCKFGTEDRTLRVFDRFLAERSVGAPGAITPELIEDFMASRPRRTPVSFNNLLGMIRRLFEWLMIHGIVEQCPVRLKPRRASIRRTPFIFDVGQGRRLLEAAGRLPDNPRGPVRGPTYRVVLAILYGLGLRIGEASRLLVGDIDWDRRTLLIRDSKFGKSRLVPFGPRLYRALREYLDLRTHHWGAAFADQPLFTFNGRTPVSPNSIRNSFHDDLLPQLNLKMPEGIGRPRIHDLRHSFAVGVLLRWYRSGVDASARLHYLSTFLGHVNPEATAVYLTITADLLQEANRRFERFAPSFEVPP